MSAAVPVQGPPTAVQRLAGWLLARLGWRLEFRWPPVPRCVIIVYPHTSNWDFFVGYLARLAMGLPARFVGKDTLFRWPVGGLLRRMGGIPVNRRERTGFIGALAAEMARSPFMWLVLAPEGTRSRTDHLKSGFYHLALAARVPVGLGFIDWGSRRLGIVEYVDLTGDVERDLERLRATYGGLQGRRPGLASDLRFRGGPPA